MIEVLYDISILGGHDVPRYRTGIYRTVENVARGLAASSECNLTFCIGPDVETSLDHITRDEQLHVVPLAMSKSSRTRRRLFQKITDLTSSIEAGKSRSIQLSQKAARKVLYHAYETARSHSNPVDAKTLARANIFHSPFNRIPAQMRAASKLKKFLTVYDLIAVQRPELFEAPVSEGVSRVLESLTPEDFSLCISQSTKNDLCEYRPDLDSERMFVVPLGAADSFRPCTDTYALDSVRQKYGIPRHTEYILSLCTLEPRKNVAQAIRCFARVVKQEGLRDLRLVLVGPKGWDYDHIFSAISETENLSDYIIFTDFVADEDLSPLYSGAMAFIYLSLYEGFGLPPLEAMKCGTPVITSNTSSLPEVVGDAGKMFDPMDTEGICQGILDIYRSTELRNRMRQHSLERAKLFGWERCTRETIAAYKTAL